MTDISVSSALFGLSALKVWREKTRRERDMLYNATVQFEMVFRGLNA